MNFSKSFAFLAVLALCVLGQYAAEASFFGEIGQEVENGAHDVEGDVEHDAKAVDIGVKSGVNHVKTVAKTAAKIVVHDGKDVVKVVEIAGDIATAAKIIKIVQILA